MQSTPARFEARFGARLQPAMQRLLPAHAGLTAAAECRKSMRESIKVNKENPQETNTLGWIQTALEISAIYSLSILPPSAKPGQQLRQHLESPVSQPFPSLTSSSRVSLHSPAASLR